MSSDGPEREKPPRDVVLRARQQRRVDKRDKVIAAQAARIQTLERALSLYTDPNWLLKSMRYEIEHCLSSVRFMPDWRRRKEMPEAAIAAAEKGEGGEGQ